LEQKTAEKYEPDGTGTETGEFSCGELSLNQPVLIWNKLPDTPETLSVNRRRAKP
jgi:hypothetical protein